MMSLRAFALSLLQRSTAATAFPRLTVLLRREGIAQHFPFRGSASQRKSAAQILR
jgi:hypothetical protein